MAGRGCAARSCAATTVGPSRATPMTLAARAEVIIPSLTLIADPARIKPARGASYYGPSFADEQMPISTIRSGRIIGERRGAPSRRSRKLIASAKISSIREVGQLEQQGGRDETLRVARRRRARRMAAWGARP